MRAEIRELKKYGEQILKVAEVRIGSRRWAVTLIKSTGDVFLKDFARHANGRIVSFGDREEARFMCLAYRKNLKAINAIRRKADAEEDS